MEPDKVKPKHYRTYNLESWEMMLKIWGPSAFITHCEMTAFKYRMRIGLKPGEDVKTDLSKAQWYEAKAEEIRKGLNNPPITT